MTSPNWRAPRGDNGDQLVDSCRPATVRGTSIPSSRAASLARLSPFNAFAMSLTFNSYASLNPVYPLAAISSQRRRYSGIPPV